MPDVVAVEREQGRTGWNRSSRAVYGAADHPAGASGVRSSSRPAVRATAGGSILLGVTDILERARVKVLDEGTGLSYDELVEVLQLPDDQIPELLELAHAVRMKHCGPEVEVEGIISLKTGGCPEDCHFCSQSGQFTSPVRSVWLDIPQLVKAAEETAATGATEFCIVAAVRGPDERLMTQVRDGIEAIQDAVDINVACSLGMLTQEQVDDLARWACTATTTTSRPRSRTSRRWSPRTPTRSAGTPARWSASPAWSCAAAGWSAWASRSSSAPSSPRSWPSSTRTRCR